MLTKEWAALKNGSDIRGVASEGIPGADVNLTDDVIFAIAKGFVVFLTAKYNVKPENLTISIGHDSRISAQRIKMPALRQLPKAG